jgi:hypothetical protein
MTHKLNEYTLRTLEDGCIYLEKMRYLHIAEAEYKTLWLRAFPKEKKKESKESRIDSLLLLSRCWYKHDVSPRLYRFIENLIRDDTEGVDGYTYTGLITLGNFLVNDLCDFSEPSKELESLVSVVATYAHSRLTYQHGTDPIEMPILRCVQLMVLKLCTEYKKKISDMLLLLLFLRVKNFHCCTMATLRAIAGFSTIPSIARTMIEMGFLKRLQVFLASRREKETDVPLLQYTIRCLSDNKASDC